ncbi:MAG: hypothetical protein ACO1O6_12845 [Bacteroidota bacterium]
MKKKVLLFSAAVLIFSADALAQGCSQCKLLAEQGSEMDESAFGSNINTGILYLMVIPYLLLMFLFRKPIVAFFKGLFAKKA